ncbi:hypothetical protein HK104_006944 [Borealophlyctis nickersoniae]|nr:hypothetical protein HK104_006944 [Borealophlyctis nickersoniae]
MEIERSPGAAPPLTLETATTRDERFQVLHNEIVDLATELSPRYQEIELRHYIINALMTVVHQALPGAQVELFGSQRSGLFLPSADIDMVVHHRHYNEKGVLEKIMGCCYHHFNLVDLQTLVYIKNARVPILKFSTHLGGVKVDISANNFSGGRSSELVKSWLLAFDRLHPLSLILKYWLHERNLHDPANGGIGGYAIVNMALSVIMANPELQTRPDALGRLLHRFFGFFGSEFSAATQCVSVAHPAIYLPKTKGIKQLLEIRDPSDPRNNISSASRNFREIFTQFNHCYVDLEATLNGKPRNSRSRKTHYHHFSNDMFLNPMTKGGFVRFVLEDILELNANMQMTRDNQPREPLWRRSLQGGKESEAHRYRRQEGTVGTGRVQGQEVAQKQQSGIGVAAPNTRRAAKMERIPTGAATTPQAEVGVLMMGAPATGTLAGVAAPVRVPVPVRVRPGETAHLGPTSPTRLLPIAERTAHDRNTKDPDLGAHAHGPPLVGTGGSCRVIGAVLESWFLLILAERIHSPLVWFCFLPNGI